MPLVMREVTFKKGQWLRRERGLVGGGDACSFSDTDRFWGQNLVLSIRQLQLFLMLLCLKHTS